jgi:hypothetical protein
MLPQGQQLSDPFDDAMQPLFVVL